VHIDGAEIYFVIVIFATFGPLWPWPWLWPWITSYSIPSCITHRPLSAHQSSFKSEQNFLWTDGRTGGRTDTDIETSFIDWEEMT